jgi:hypothetical protein
MYTQIQNDDKLFLQLFQRIWFLFVAIKTIYDL